MGDTRLDETTLRELEQKGREIRRSILTMVHRARSGHVGGSLGATELVVALYHVIMRHDPANPGWKDRDRFILSKGHCTPIIYSVLADCGYFPREDLETFRRPGSHLQGHPYHPKTPGIEASTGTLGLGLSTGLGMALAAKVKGETHRYFILCGDGEMQEGQVWEAALFGHKYALDNVVVFVDRNSLQTDGDTERVMPLDPLAPKWEAFGWDTHEIDGHDYREIVGAVERAGAAEGRPSVIIARTTKGKGISFMEGVAKWHGTPPTDEEYARAMAELDGGA
jgi:transketolase